MDQSDQHDFDFAEFLFFLREELSSQKFKILIMFLGVNVDRIRQQISF